MPASMIRAPTGGNPKVIGSSMAMVASGPTPGSTPTSVPTMAPIRHRKRFMPLKATPKPIARLLRRSVMTVCSNLDAALAEAQQGRPAEIGRPQLKRQVERDRKQQHAERRQNGAPDERFQRAPLVGRKGSRQDAAIARDDEPERTDGDREDEDREGDEQRPAHKIPLRTHQADD